jgi:hypothetical protein
VLDKRSIALRSVAVFVLRSTLKTAEHSRELFALLNLGGPVLVEVIAVQLNDRLFQPFA